MRIQLRRGTAATWTTVNPTLAVGELGYETDTKKLKIGDGVTAWNSLVYLPSLVAALNAFAGAISASRFTETGGARVLTTDWAIDGLDLALAIYGPGVSQNVFTSRNDATSTYVRNAFNFATVSGANLTGVSVYNDSGTATKTATLLSPRHVLLANHYYPAHGSSIRFVTAGNVVVNRTLTNTTRIGSTDIRIGILDSDVPGTIGFYKVLPRFIEDRQIGRGMLFVNQNQQLAVADISASASAGHFGIAQSNSSNRRAYYITPVSGDSSHPLFLLLDDELILLGAFGTGGSAPSIAYNYDAINTAMTALGGSYQLTAFDGVLQIPVPVMPAPGVANGYAPLDEAGLLSVDYLPESAVRWDENNTFEGQNTFSGGLEVPGDASFTGGTAIAGATIEELTLSSVIAASVLTAIGDGIVTATGVLATQAVRLNAAGTAFEAFTPARRVGVPATPTSTGTVGDYASDATHLYVVHATNAWRRVAVSVWP